MAIKAVIFDLDGVILDTFVVMPEIYKVIKKELDLDTRDQVFESGDFFRVDWREHLKQLGITAIQTVNKVVEIYQREYARLEHNIKPFQGIKKVLEKLNKQYKLAIVSNNPLDKMEYLLKKFELREYFECIIGVVQEAMKPDPTQIIICLDCLKVKPEEAVYIGDMDGDVLAARNAQLKKVIVVTYGYHSKDKLMKVRPDEIISKPEEILEALK